MKKQITFKIGSQNKKFVDQSEMLKVLNGIIACCDGNNSTHEEIYHIANDALKAFNLE